MSFKPSVPVLDRGNSICHKIEGAWPFYETNPAVLHDTVHENHGSKTGTINPENTPYGYGMAIPTGAGNYFSVPDSPCFTFGDGTTDEPFSVHCLVNLDTINNNGIIAKDDSSAREWMFRIVGSGLYMITLDDSTGAWVGRRFTSPAMVANRWYSCVGTYDGSGVVGGFKIYLDGVRVDTTNVSNGSYTAMEDTSAILGIGAQRNSSLNIKGSLANVAIWRRELSQNEVSIINSDPFVMYQKPDFMEWLGGTLSADTGFGGLLSTQRNRLVLS